MSTLYRWQCECGKHGRWLRDGNMASVYGTRHEDARHSYGYDGTPTATAWIYDNTGRRLHPAS